MHPAPLEGRFDTLAGWRAALADLILQSRDELLIFDADLAGLGLASRDGIARLEALLGTGGRPCLRIVVHEFTWIERDAPRLMALLRRYAHVAPVRRSPDSLRQLSEPFAVGDGAHLALRFHADHARGRFAYHQPDQAEPWRRRFEDLWQCCEESLPLTRLGL